MFYTKDANEINTSDTRKPEKSQQKYMQLNVAGVDIFISFHVCFRRRKSCCESEDIIGFYLQM